MIGLDWIGLGGINKGINLTAADTCIIYDSDWNPQNDIQAQARCHRIGQTQMVKVYRLLTRNTYETAMFDKASKKLGLDQAVLTKMKSTKSSATVSSNKKLQLGKKEVEELLRNGAYGAFDDSAKDQYDEEDIDKILERSIIIKDDPKAKNTVNQFSKASFVSAEASSNAHIDVTDPDFWNKINPDRKKDKNKGSKDQSKSSRGRKRNQSNQYHYQMLLMDDSDEDDEEEDNNENHEGEDYSEEEDDSNNESADDNSDIDEEFKGGDENKKKSKKMEVDGEVSEDKGWSHKERMKLKSGLFQYGYGQWNIIKRNYILNSWTIEEIKDYTDEFIRKSIEILGENVEEGLSYIKKWYIKERGYSTEDETEDKTEKRRYRNDPTLNDKKFKKYAMKYSKLLIRKLESIANISKIVIQTIKYYGEYFPIPNLENEPTPCKSWNKEDDKSLILGIYYHGYGHFSEMCSDPRLSLSRFIYEKKQNLKSSAKNNNNTITAPAEQDKNPEISFENPEQNQQEISENDEDEKTKNDESMEIIREPWPAEKLINRRLRKLLRTIAFELISKGNGVSNIEDFTFTKTVKTVKKTKKENENLWKKREKTDIYKFLTCFGVPKTLTGDTDWKFVQEKTNLTNKSLSSIENYCKAVISQSEGAVKSAKEYETWKKALKDKNKDGNKQETESGVGDANLSVTQCKRIMERIKLMKSIREKLLPQQESLSEHLKLTVTPSHLPPWWKPAVHDIALLQAICKHGFSQWEKICSDEEFPFFHLANSLSKTPLLAPGAPEPADNASNPSADPKTAAAAAAKKKRGRQSEIFTGAINFPKDKTLMNRIDYLLNVLTNFSVFKASAKDTEADIITNQAQPDKKITTNPFDRPKSPKKSSPTKITAARPLSPIQFPQISSPTQPGANPTRPLSPIHIPRPNSPLFQRPSSPTIIIHHPVSPGRSSEGSGRNQRSSSPLRVDPTKSPSKKSNTTYVDVARSVAGDPIFPIKLGKLRVMSLGQVNILPDYHSRKYIWPVGFKSLKQYQSFSNPATKIDYICEILDGGEKPIFSVTASDALDQPATASNATAAWSIILKRIHENNPEQAKKASAVSGPEYFGIARPIIKKVLFK